MKYCLTAFILFLLVVFQSCKPVVKKVSSTSGNSTALVTLANKTQNITTKVCSTNCIECKEGICSKCPKGFFSFENKCVLSCTNSTFADNYSQSCKKKENNPIFIKAYTFSLCMNKCGQVFSDCSCNPKCKLTGTCCSDYKYCDYVNESISQKIQCPIPNCLACSNDQAVCLMCNQGYFFHENQCLEVCPKDTILIQKNSVCLKKPTCGVENCERCEGTRCVKCQQGMFLHENECTPSCPLGTRANRIDFTCVNKSTFAFFMIFPSANSCKGKGKCGVWDVKYDCSCHHHCLKDGNCCDDFDVECKNEIKLEKCKTCNECVDGKCLLCQENAELVKGDCNCMNGYYYSILKDRCERNEYQKKYGHKGSDYLGKMLVDSFLSRGTTEMAAIGEIRPYISRNVIFNGNVSMNIFVNNENLSIISKSVLNEDSYNNSTKIEKNINSKNILMKTSGRLKDIAPIHIDHIHDSKAFHDEMNIHNIQDERKNEESVSNESQAEDSNASKRKESIIINKHLHLNHAKYFPKDLDHKEGQHISKVNVTKKEITKKKEDNDLNAKGKPKKTKTIKKPHEDEKINDSSKSTDANEESSQGVNQKSLDTKSPADIQKKVHINIHIPGMKENGKDNQSEGSSTNNIITVHNRYFINDKSMTLNKPKNPNVFNFYNKDCKSGACENNGEFSKIKYASDKEYDERSYNKTIMIEQNGILVVNRKGNEDQRK